MMSCYVERHMKNEYYFLITEEWATVRSFNSLLIEYRRLFDIINNSIALYRWPGSRIKLH